ncbi:hypothetical protein [Paenibacillus hexagrammi]|uniref:Phage protein n=1 Tax=Paenibacillus hexagrammi TaxID=2908839 RepID=A0ABY3SSB1_9BACL|nr:hypothetical protein [Paenibacillus sp. YPD9-1]UJF36544.1 hypothetical protein L0M14_30620 [Paenibacillus sp. YPD9-1]
MIDYIMEEIEIRIKKLNDTMLSFNLIGNSRGAENARNRKTELESTLRFIRDVVDSAQEDEPTDDVEARVWVENGVIKCMSQMCVGADGVKCPRFNDCDIVVFGMEKIIGTDEGGDN